MELDLGTNRSAPNNMLPFMGTFASGMGSESSEFIGRLISITATDGSYYQGRVQSVDSFQKSITIKTPFKDGIPLKEGVFTIPASSVRDLKIVQPRNTTGHGCIYSAKAVTSTPKSGRGQQKPMSAPAKFVKEARWDKVSCPVQQTRSNNEQEETTNVSIVSEILGQGRAEINVLPHKSDERKENEQVATLEEESKKSQGSLSEATAAIDGVRISLGDLFMAERPTDAPKTNQETVSATQAPVAELPKPPNAPTTHKLPAVVRNPQQLMKGFMKSNRISSPQMHRPPPALISMRQISSPQIISQHILSNQIAGQQKPAYQISNQYTACHPMINQQIPGYGIVGPQNWAGNSWHGNMAPGNFHPSNNAHTNHSKYGEFRHFREQQIPIPRVLQINRSRNFREPSGIPMLDCANGYSAQQRNADGLEFDQPIDFNEINTDFDFESNLALFDKSEFPVQEGEVGQEADPNVLIIPKRNFRNDENVLSDPSKVISWTMQNTKRSELEEAVKEFCGCLISIIGEDGSYYQGKVIRVDPFQKTIVLEKPFKDGIPIKEPSLTLDAPAVRDLKILRMGDYNQPITPQTRASTSNNENKMSGTARNQRQQGNEAKKQPKRIHLVEKSVKTVNRSQNNTKATPEKNRNSHEAGNKKKTQSPKAYGAPPAAHGPPPPNVPGTSDGVRITVHDLFSPKAPKAHTAKPQTGRIRTLVPSNKKNAMQKNQHVPQQISSTPVA